MPWRLSNNTSPMRSFILLLRLHWGKNRLHKSVPSPNSVLTSDPGVPHVPFSFSWPECDRCDSPRSHTTRSPSSPFGHLSTNWLTEIRSYIWMSPGWGERPRGCHGSPRRGGIQMGASSELRRVRLLREVLIMAGTDHKDRRRNRWN